MLINPPIPRTLDECNALPKGQELIAAQALMDQGDVQALDFLAKSLSKRMSQVPRLEAVRHATLSWFNDQDPKRRACAKRWLRAMKADSITASGHLVDVFPDLLKSGRLDLARNFVDLALDPQWQNRHYNTHNAIALVFHRLVKNLDGHSLPTDLATDLAKHVLQKLNEAGPTAMAALNAFDHIKNNHKPAFLHHWQEVLFDTLGPTSLQEPIRAILDAPTQKFDTTTLSMAMHAATLGALDDDTLKRLWSMRTEKAKGTMPDFIATVVQNSTFDDDPDRAICYRALKAFFKAEVDLEKTLWFTVSNMDLLGTPLVQAAAYGEPELVRLYLSAGANPRAHGQFPSENDPSTYKSHELIDFIAKVQGPSAMEGNEIVGMLKAHEAKKQVDSMLENLGVQVPSPKPVWG